MCGAPARVRDAGTRQGQRTRARIIGELLASPAGLSPAQIAARLGLHHTAVRRHLERLAGEGRVVSQRMHGGGRGRPADVYRAIDRKARDAAALEELTTALIKLISTAEIPAEEIADIGRASGARGQVSGRGAVIAEVGRLGFGPKELPTESGRSTGTLSIRLCNCPFRTAVESEGGEAVCQLHRGIVAGIADAAGGRLTRFGIDHPAAGNCMVEIEGVRESDED